MAGLGLKCISGKTSSSVDYALQVDIPRNQNCMFPKLSESGAFKQILSGVLGVDFDLHIKGF
jgi:hypothetical protein